MYKKLLMLLALVVTIQINATEIALLTDIHVTPGNANEGKLRDAVDEINRSNAQIVILSGDLSNEGSDEQLYNVKSILDGIKKPLYVIPGNHELNWSQSAGKTFNDIWGADRFVTELDGYVIVGITCGPFMKMGDGHIKQEDLAWLDNTLKQHVTAGKKVISVNHYPILPDLDNVNDYIKVLQKYPVAVHLCGHYHQFRKYEGGGIDGLINRALDMKNGNYGYTIIEAVNDSIKQWDKQLGKERSLVCGFPIRKTIEPLKEEAAKEYPLPEGASVKLLHQDGASIFTRVAVDSKNVYFGTSLGKMKAIDKNSGEERWELAPRVGMLFSRPAVNGNEVYFPTPDHRIFKLNANCGCLNGLLNNDGPYVADGVVVNGVLYQGAFKKFQAWDLKNDSLLWSFNDINNYCQAAPIIDGNDVIFGAWDTYLRCLDRKTGKLKWKWSNGSTANMLGPGNCVPVVTKKQVIIVAPDRYMTAIDRKTGKQIWRIKDHKVRESLGMSADGKAVYAKTMDGEVIAVSTDKKKYELLWVVDAGFGYEHTPCVVVESKGIVYAASKSGMLAAIDPIKRQLLWQYKLGNSAVNGFEVDANGDIYASLIEGKIYRISTK